MKILKGIVRKLLAYFGYEINPVGASVVRYENFLNLVTVYEEKLNSEQFIIPPNDLRPKLLARLFGTPPSEAYFIVKSLSECKNISGDVCEFGVAQGETSALIANELAIFGSKRLHLFDSFVGLPKPSEKDQLKDDIFLLGSIEAYAGTMSCPEDMVRSRLDSISFPKERYVIHKGFIEKLLCEDKELPEKVCFAYVDFDFYEPIKITLDFLDNVTPIGSIIVVDDYDFFSSGVKTAVDEFVESKTSSEIMYDCFVPKSCYGNFAILTKVSTKLSN